MSGSICAFVSPPNECSYRREGGDCVAPGESFVVNCVVNHRRLLLTSGGRARALQAFIDVHLDNPSRQKPMSGQPGREAISG